MKDTEIKKEQKELKAFESSINDFISRTPDFNKYALEVDKWLDTHDETDITVAYRAVKDSKEVEVVKELNYFKKLFADLAPLLDKLERNPKIVKAIMDGSIK
jgi:hypothetical protein